MKKIRQLLSFKGLNLGRALFVLCVALVSVCVLADFVAIPSRAAGPWYVQTDGNDANSCLSPGANNACATLNAAIRKASPGDTIYVAAGVYTDSGNEVMLIDKLLNISGGWDGSFSTQIGVSTIDGENQRRVVKVLNESGGDMLRFVIQNGRADGAPGISNEGSLRLVDCTVQHNTDIGDATSEGGGIRNGVVLNLYNTTVSENTSSSGAGIFNAWGQVNLNNSTVSGNIASGHGGGINNLGGTVEIFSSTISNNTDSLGAGGIHNESGGSVSLNNTILAGNVGAYGVDCAGSISSMGYNVIGNTINCSYSPGNGDLINLEAFLGSLQDNGGTTYTHALTLPSPAINGGDPGGCKDYLGGKLDSDQRGLPRVQRCDVGAFEFQNELLKIYLPMVSHDIG